MRLVKQTRENLAFNPWHSLAEHSPLGSISDARRLAYAASAKVRRAANGPSGYPSPLESYRSFVPSSGPNHQFPPLEALC